jgi:ferrous iron transport protein B
VMELPSYKWPSPHIVLHRVYDRARAFVLRAGTLIFATSIVVWAASYFPGDHQPLFRLEEQIQQAETTHSADLQKKHELEESKAKLSPEESARLTELDNQLAATEERLAPLNSLRSQQYALSEKLLETSFLGQFGKAIEPAVRPLGWDWRIGVGVLASFPAREVIVSTLGTLYSLGGNVDEADTGLHQALRDSKHPDGSSVYSIPVALSIMVFFALCAQCASTLMVIRRETNSWAWSLFTFAYMTTLAYVAAWIVYQVSVRWVM